MPKNSFLIEDILDSKENKTKKFTMPQITQKLSPSLSPASFVSSASSSDDNNNLEINYTKHPGLFLNQFVANGNEQYHLNMPDYNFLMSTLLNGYSNPGQMTDESIQLLASYYQKFLSSSTHSQFEQHSKRIKLDTSLNDKLKNDSIENVSPLDALLQLSNNTFINRTGLFNQTANLPQNQDINIKQSKSISSNLSQKSSSSTNTSFESIKNDVQKSQKLTNSSNSHLLNNKRKRKNRTAFTANQIFELEKRFSSQRYLSPHDRDRIAYELQLTTAQVITWFQNRRAKQKRDLEELKNDVNAAKNLKVIDQDIDVDKIIQSSVGQDGLANNKNKSLDLNSQSSNEDECDEDDDDLDIDDENEINIENESNLSNSLNNSITKSPRYN